MYHSHVSMIYATDTPKMYHCYWYCTKNVSWYLILDTFFVSRYVSWYMYHWYSPTLPIWQQWVSKQGSFPAGTPGSQSYFDNGNGVPRNAINPG